jgi:hypothetical protein
MIGGRGTWPILLADLSLILFVATAVQASHSAARQGRETSPSAKAAEPAAPGIPQAFYLAEPGAPPLSQWIAEQGLGDEAQVTILSSYRPGKADAALALADVLAREAVQAGRAPRVLVEPGDGSVRAILSYDRPQMALGR